MGALQSQGPTGAEESAEKHTLREPDGRNAAGCDVGNARRSSAGGQEAGRLLMNKAGFIC
jgi:hypothetical protein